MRILTVAATSVEVAPLIAQLRYSAERGPSVKAYAHPGHDVDVLVTGIGMVATAAWTCKILTQGSYDLVLNIGVCGSFDAAVRPATVVHVVSDCIAELGAEDGDRFLTAQELGLLADDDFPFAAGRLVNSAPPQNATLNALPAVAGITVNTVHGSERSIADVTRRFRPEVESMEGAGFMYACLIHGVVFAQIRAVSNVVEKRNREAWKITEAIASLTDTALKVLDHA